MTKDERIAAMQKRRDRARDMVRVTSTKRFYRRRKLHQAQVAYYEAVLVELERL